MVAFTTAATTRSYNNNNMKGDKSYTDASTTVFESLERLIVRVASACTSALKTATSAVQTLLDAITPTFSTPAEISASTEYASKSVASSDDDDNADAIPILEDDGDYENELALPTQEAMEQADEEHDVDNDFHFSEDGDEDDDDAVPMLEDDCGYENESAFDLPMLEATGFDDEEEHNVHCERDEDGEDMPMLEDDSNYENELALPMLETMAHDDDEDDCNIGSSDCVGEDEVDDDVPMLKDDSEYEDELAFPMLQVTQEDDGGDVGDDDASAREDRYAVPVSDDDVVSKLDGRTNIDNDFASLMQETSRSEEEQDDAGAIFVDAVTAMVLPRVRRHILDLSAAQLYARKTCVYACRREMCAAINRAR